MDDVREDNPEDVREVPEEGKNNDAGSPKEKEYLNGWKRCLADFDNYKKQQARFLEDVKAFSHQDLIQGLIPILDSFNSALETLPKEEAYKEWKQGFSLIKGQLEEELKARGLSVIDSLGVPFDPAFHEAVETVESEQESGTVIEELQKGYALNGKVIRPARVKVAK